MAETREAASSNGTMQPGPATRRRMVEWLGVLALVLCAAALFVTNNDFSRH